VLLYGDNKPYCVALVTLTEDGAKVADARAQVAAAVESLNETLAGYEQIKKFEVLGEDFTEQNGQLTPSLKVKRKVAVERHRVVIDSMYR
jgi:long-chain acyl-CoA synthetase